MRRSLYVSIIALAVAAVSSADWNKGLEAFKNRDYATALREFQGVIEQTKTHAGSHYYIGRCYNELNRASDALAAFKEANRLDPESPLYATYYASALLSAQRYREAAEALSKVKMDGLNAKQRSTILTQRARAEVEAGDAAGAEVHARQVTQIDNSSAAAWGILGLAQMNQGKFGDAFAAFRRAWDLTSDVAYGKNAVGAGIAAARASGSKSQKDQIFAQTAEVATSLAQKKGGAEGALLAGEALLGANDYDEALQWFNRSGLDNALVNYYKGQCFVGKKEAARAERFLRDALLKQPDQQLRKNIYNSLGFVLEDQKKFAEAVQAYQEAGNQSKVAEVNDKAKRAEQNKLADQEQARYEELKRLQEQYKELSGGGGPAPTPTPSTRR